MMQLNLELYFVRDGESEAIHKYFETLSIIYSPRSLKLKKKYNFLASISPDLQIIYSACSIPPHFLRMHDLLTNRLKNDWSRKSYVFLYTGRREITRNI